MTSSGVKEFVYASPAQGAAQVALAVAAYHCCKQATIFVAARGVASPRTREAQAYGARVIEVAPGYLSVVQARAKAYAIKRGAFYVDFGGGNIPSGAITQTAEALDIAPDQVWCAAGSGTLARALKRAWPQARLFAVAVGKTVSLGDGIVVLPSAYKYEEPCRSPTPFPANPIYEAKAWEMLKPDPNSSVVFWNVSK